MTKTVLFPTLCHKSYTSRYSIKWWRVLYPTQFQMVEPLRVLASFLFASEKCIEGLHHFRKPHTDHQTMLASKLFVLPCDDLLGLGIQAP